MRRAKQALLTDGVEALQKKLKKGRGVTKALVEERQRRVKEIIDKIYAVPDGIGGNRRPQQQYRIAAAYPAAGGRGGAPPVELSTAGPSGARASPLYYEATEESARLEADWAAAKKKQDAQLERIERGVGALGEMAAGMQEELGRQEPVIDDIDAQLHRVTTKLKSNNAKLKGLVLQAS